MLPCMAFHFPPPENWGGGASATALSAARNLPKTFFGQAARNSRPGTDFDGSSASWRWKKWIAQGWDGAGEVVEGSWCFFTPIKITSDLGGVADVGRASPIAPYPRNLISGTPLRRRGAQRPGEPRTGRRGALAPWAHADRVRRTEG